MHTRQQADVSLVLSGTRTLVDCLCLVDADCAALKASSKSQGACRYVLLTETAQETCARIARRMRMGDTLIATSGVVGMQGARLAMFFGVAPPCDGWIEARRRAFSHAPSHVLERTASKTKAFSKPPQEEGSGNDLGPDAAATRPALSSEMSPSPLSIDCVDFAREPFYDCEEDCEEWSF